MIPREQLDPRALQMLVEYLYHEIQKTLSERRPLEDKWKRWLTTYKAEPEEKVKTFPFYGAANIVVPVAATDIDVVFARLMGILFAPDNLFSTRAKKPEMVEFAPRLQEFLHAVQYVDLNSYNVISDWVMQICKLGTGILKTRYRRQHKMAYEYREGPFGIQESHRVARIKDSPEFAFVNLFDFLQPASATNIQDSPWSAERVLLTWQQYLNRVREGIYLPVPRLQSWLAASRGSHVLEHMMKLDNFRPTIGDKLELWEVWVEAFDITGQGEPRSLVITLHLPTWSVVRVDWNPWISQQKPYDSARFLRQEGQFLGIGMCEMLDPFQDEITAMHRQRIDSGTLANSMIFLGKNGVVTEDEPIYPGRWFIVNNMDDIQTLNMSAGKFDTSIQYESVTADYAKRRSGVNEYVAGQFAPSVGYATAHTNLQQTQAATQRFDQTLREIREAWGSAVVKAVELYQQFDRPGRAYEILGEKDGEIMQRFIEFPIQSIRDGIGIEVTATSASLNKELEIRTNTIQMQMLTEFYRNIIEGLTLAFAPNMPPEIQAIIFQMIQGGSILMRRILEAQGTQDTDDLVPHIRDLLSGQLPIGQLVGESFGPGQGGFAPVGGGPAATGAPSPFGNGAQPAPFGDSGGGFVGAGVPGAGGGYGL